MDTRSPSPDDRFLPPEPGFAGGGQVARLAVTLVALLVLVALGSGGYFWLVGNVSQRKAQAAMGAPDTAVTASIALPVVPTRVVAPVASSAATATAFVAPVVSVDLGAIDDPDQRRSVCGYLVAELGRLDYEFSQPLPPPVIDRIATEVAQLRTQAGRYDCTPSSQPNVNAVDAPLPHAGGT